MLAWMINTPVFGTLFYNIFVKEKNIETLFKEKYFYLPENVTSEMIKTYYECCHSGGAVCKYLFSSQVGHYTTVNIKHCLSSINNNIFIISGEDSSDQEAAEEYKTVLPSIEITSIKETKYLPHLEAPGKFLEQVAILFSQEEEPLYLLQWLFCRKTCLPWIFLLCMFYFPYLDKRSADIRSGQREFYNIFHLSAQKPDRIL